MPLSGNVGSQNSAKGSLRLGWQVFSTVAAGVAVVLSILVFSSRLQRFEASVSLLLVLLLATCTVIFIHGRFLLHLHRQHNETAGALSISRNEFQQMADNIQEIFWILDATTKKTVYVNQAYEAITRRPCESLIENPFSYERVIHPEDRVHILEKLKEATQTGKFDQRFRIEWPTGEVRWIWVHGFPLRDSESKIYRLVGTALDITAQQHAELQVAANLELAQNAWAESEALRKAALALTQNLRMDLVLDTLLKSLSEIIPCECSRICLLEGDTRLFVAREWLLQKSPKKKNRYPLTLDAADLPFLKRILANRKSSLIDDTRQEPDWRRFKGHSHLHSWLCVPLIAANKLLGIISVGHTKAGSLTVEDLRRTELLAIPAAAAIQNSRLYECASIYASELEKRIKDVEDAKRALEESEHHREISDEKFQKLFRSSPVALFISTANEGRVLDVNAAFEHRHGYSRPEIIGHTLDELNMWEDSSDRAILFLRVQNGHPIRNVTTRFRTKSGEIKLTTYSADSVQFDGQPCILGISEDVKEAGLRHLN